MLRMCKTLVGVTTTTRAERGKQEIVPAFLHLQRRPKPQTTRVTVRLSHSDSGFLKPLPNATAAAASSNVSTIAVCTSPAGAASPTAEADHLNAVFPRPCCYAESFRVIQSPSAQSRAPVATTIVLQPLPPGSQGATPAWSSHMALLPAGLGSKLMRKTKPAGLGVPPVQHSMNDQDHPRHGCAA